MEQLEGISQAEFDKDDQRDDRTVENAGRHEREIADDVDQRLVGVVGQLGVAVPRAAVDALDGDARQSHEEGQQDVGREVERREHDELQAELVFPADEFLFRRRYVV